MSETPSSMIPLGTKAPDFALMDAISSKPIRLSDHRSPIATVIMFICNHCPYVKLILATVVKVAKTYQAQGISFIAISSNDAAAYPADAPEAMRAEALRQGFTFPYLIDETQAVAKAYHAACTPDFYIFDRDLLCVYRGRFDAATPGNNLPVTGSDLMAALEAVLRGEPVNEEQVPSLGCNIKWKK